MWVKTDHFRILVNITKKVQTKKNAASNYSYFIQEISTLQVTLLKFRTILHFIFECLDTLDHLDIRLLPASNISINQA